MDQLLTGLTGFGPWGIVVASLLLLIRTQEQLSKERDERIADAKEYTETALALQSRIFECVERLEAMERARRRP